MNPRVVSYWGNGWNFHCPGCQEAHIVPDDGRWKFSGTEACPTFAPSLITHLGEDKGNCHLFIRNGFLEFLSDSPHALAGHVVPMRSIEGTYLDVSE